MSETNSTLARRHAAVFAVEHAHADLRFQHRDAAEMSAFKARSCSVAASKAPGLATETQAPKTRTFMQSVCGYTGPASRGSPDGRGNRIARRSPKRMLINVP